MPKKPAKNSYFYFMLDFKHRAERNGQQYADLVRINKLIQNPLNSCYLNYVVYFT